MNKTSILTIAGLAGLLVLSTPALAQEAVPAAAQDAAQDAAPAATVTGPASQEWNAVSRSTTRVYMVDINSIKKEGGVASVDLARVPLAPEEASDRRWTLVKMEFRCSAKESRAVSETDHDEAGVAQDAFDTGESFSPYTADMLDAYVANVVCDDARPQPPTYASIEAFITAGRPSPRQ